MSTAAAPRSAGRAQALDAALRRLLQGIEADTAACAQLKPLLQQQFDAALRHNAQALAALAMQITALVESMGANRAERVALLKRLVDASGEDAMERCLARLPEPLRAPWRERWDGLCASVAECKRLNVRNGQLLMDQYEIIQRVIGVAEVTYAA
ncbi:MAG TPA: flagellar export chaperone FlgN [Burkholderiaceae bacterium]|nr:flagellar export chaperone FlgN [Burkholderiaceae bacterium]